MEEFKIKFGAQLEDNAGQQLQKHANSLLKDFKVKVGIDIDENSLSKAQNKIIQNINKLNNINTKIDLFEKVIIDDEKLKSKIVSIKKEIASLNSIDLNSNKGMFEYTKNLTEIDGKVKLLINSLKVAETSTKTVFDALDISKQAKSLKDVETYIKNNSKAARDFGTQLENTKNNIASATNPAELKTANSEFRLLKSSIKSVGLEGRSMGQELKNAMSKFSNWIGASTIIMQGIRGVKAAFSSIYDLDTQLVDLKKTSNATNAELKDFYYTSNDVAKNLGETTSAVIKSASSWSRLGYKINEAKTMASTSSIFSAISPEMDITQSTEGLISSMKAFKIEANDALDEVGSKVNAIGNSQPVDNLDIVEILKRSASAMAEANNSIDETIALGTAGDSVVRNAESVGTALKTISLRVRGYDEEVEGYTQELANLDGEIANLTKTASTPGGISLFTDDSRETYKSTYKIFKDISEIYNSLNDKTQANLLEKLGGKRQANIVASIIQNMDMAEESMETMANSTGGAMKEMDVIYESMEYKLNKLSQTGVGIFQNLLNTDVLKGGIDLLTGLLSVLNGITESIGSIGTVGAVLGGVLGAKGLGWTN